MAYGYALLTDWNMGLIVRRIKMVRLPGPVGDPPALLPLLEQEIRLLSALVDEEAT
jgi:hypothetical protein